jgi:hypothetical protein
MIIGGRHIRRGTHLLINQHPLVLITSPLALASPWVSPLISTCSDCHKIIFRFAHSNTVMITATVTRDLALPAPPVRPSRRFGFQHLSYYLRALRLDDLKPGALSVPPQR